MTNATDRPTDRPLVLSLFPGIGLLDMAFEQQGFCVVRGPDVLWGGDIRKFHPPAGKFDGVIGGPPCQAHSRMRHLVQHVYGKVAEDLIPEFERCVAECRPTWFLMENVEDAPVAHVEGYRVHRLMLNARWCGSEQQRLRAFSFGSTSGAERLTPQLEVFEPYGYEPPVLASDGKRRVSVKIGGSGTVKSSHKHAIKAGMSRRDLARSVELQGLPVGFFDHSPFTVEGQYRVLGNGVPLPMGLAVALAVKRAMGYTCEAIACGA